ncbi:ABC transporter permease [Enterococcus sulfureus ATCC 49903]|uniref:ABC transporter permease n=1 Tax=Enterococcus sulfureus ATCC 49903 TaxID=1140003 RepID=S0L3Q4_9ENTE|nr:methionine ABC transporter permease [Enterococcus sulfureus]EOT51487.1 ABC transporter permease [Enterococcus sulfureus ATCC 49903]EOT87144.1 ABC transporter permease [Enterococcus sulfureus ATCC 49903]
MDTWNTVIYYWPELVVSLKETAIMMSISLLFCLVIGLPLGVYLYLVNPSQKSYNPLIYYSLNFFITLIRSFPYLLLVVTLIPVTRMVVGRAFGPIPAAVPLSLVAIAIFARLVEQVLLDLPESTQQLADSLGVTRWQLIWHFLLVEARSGIVLAFTTTTVSLVSYSTVMGIVGGGGIGDFAIRYGYQRYEYGIMYVAIVWMIASVFVIQLGGNALARKIDKRK